MIVHYCDQRSDEWKRLRLGKLTGSKAGDAFMRNKRGTEFLSGRKNLITQLVLERITHEPQERDAYGRTIANGIATEPYAKFAYECLEGVVLRDVGFVEDEERPIGCSPDGVLGNFEGIVQVKCPLAATHLSMLVERADLLKNEKPETQAVPQEYQYQIAHELFVTKAPWCDFVSYHPDFPESLRLLTIRFASSEETFTRYLSLLDAFLQEVDDGQKAVQRLVA